MDRTAKWNKCEDAGKIKFKRFRIVGIDDTKSFVEQNKAKAKK